MDGSIFAHGGYSAPVEEEGVLNCMKSTGSSLVLKLENSLRNFSIQFLEKH